MNMFRLIFLTALAGALLAGPVENLKPGEWYEVPNSHLETVKASPTQFPWIQGVSGVWCAISCWCGGAFDTQRNRLYIGPGGGHAGYAGNEVYAFDVDDLSWSRLNDPSPLESGECTNDSVPFALHSYDGLEYMPNIDRYVVVGGWCTAKTYAMDPDVPSHWEVKAPSNEGRTGDISAYDPGSGHLFFLSGFQGRLADWNPTNDTWTLRTGSLWSYQYYGTGVIDPKRNLMVIVGGGKVRTVMVTAPYTAAIISTTGDTEIQDAGNPGVEYDPVMDKIVCWNTGTDLYSLDLDTKVWARHGASTANTTDPGLPNSNGTYGRFRYVPSKNAYVLVNNTNENAFIYRLTSWQDTLPVTALNVYAQDTTLEEYLWTYLTVVATRQGGSKDTVTGNCIYKSLDTSVAVVASSKITGKTPGTARIQVTKSTAKGIVKDTITLTVVASTATLDSLRINPDSVRLLTGDGYALQTRGYFHKNNLFFTRLIDTVASWSSGNSGVASVSKGWVSGLAMGGPVAIVASMAGKSDTAYFTVQNKPSFIKRINFQVSATPWSYGWLADIGNGFTAGQGYGWNTFVGSGARDDRQGSNFLLKSFVTAAAGNTFKVSVPDGDYIVKIGMGDNQYGVASYNWTAFGPDTVCRKLSGQGNHIDIDTITVSGGGGAVFSVLGPINYIVMISKEGIDINAVAWDDGASTALPLEMEFTPERFEKPISFRAFPNPFHGAITFEAAGLPVKSLGIYTLQGRKMADLTPLMRGGHAAWKSSLAPGIYIARLSLEGKVISKKIILMK